MAPVLFVSGTADSLSGDVSPEAAPGVGTATLFGPLGNERR